MVAHSYHDRMLRFGWLSWFQKSSEEGMFWEDDHGHWDEESFLGADANQSESIILELYHKHDFHLILSLKGSYTNESWTFQQTQFCRTLYSWLKSWFCQKLNSTSKTWVLSFFAP